MNSLLKEFYKHCISINLNNFNLNLALVCFKDGNRHYLHKNTNNLWTLPDNSDLKVSLNLKKIENTIEYSLQLNSSYETQIRLLVSIDNEENLFHLIPANIFGDNNIEKAKAGEYPILSNRKDEYCSELWEFRADRASHPISILCCDKGAAGISVAPYSKDENENLIRNGVFAGLPNFFGISLGYTNDPVTFVNKRHWEKSTFHRIKKAEASGRILAYEGNGRQTAHKIIRKVYNSTRELPKYKKSPEDALKGLFDSLININYSKRFKNYTNLQCSVPTNPTLKSWRPLVEIGWTGGGIIAYPLMATAYLQNLQDNVFASVKPPYDILDEIVNGFSEKSGLLNDVVPPGNPRQPLSKVNGWWTDFPLMKDCHCAYTNGSAAFYLLKSYDFAKKYLNTINEKWVNTALKVLDTVISLQRTDGAYGYTFETEKKAVIDWDGFAGCWFTAACAYAYSITKDIKYFDSAKKSLNYYYSFVRNLSCWGTPMDTWKSVDQESNLAFVRAARLLHEETGETEFLKMLEAGAEYNYLWQYSFRAKPEFAPLKDSNWNSCGGPVTSVSNPHLHPMGMLIVDDIKYLGEKSGDNYHLQRAEDSFAFLMNTMELYPEVTGYGQYGVLTERFCPSDGLTIERFENGEPSSIWFTYNGWAGANSLEAVADYLLYK